MTLRAGAAFVDVLPRVGRGFDADLDRSITGPSERAGKKAGGILGSSYGKAAAAAAAAFAVIKGGQFLKGTVEQAREANKVAAQTAQVIKSTGGAANLTATDFSNLAKEISNYSGVDDEAIQSSENLLATFTNVRNGLGKNNRIFDQATKAIVDMSAVQGDLRSNSILVGKALQDPVKGVTALQRVGVRLTDQQKAQVKALVATGDTMAAQKVILRELGVEFGGQAKAQATSAKRLSVAWGNVQEDIGNKLIPTLDSLAGWLADRLPGAADAMFRAGDRLGRMFAPLGSLFSRFGDQVIRAQQPAQGLAVELGRLFGISEDSTVVKVMADIFERMGRVLGPTVNMVGRLGDTFKNFGSQVLSAKDPAAGLAVEIGKLFGWAEDSSTVAALADVFERLGTILSNVWDAAGRLVTRLYFGISETVKNLNIDLKGLAEGGIQTLSDTIDGSVTKFDKFTAAVKANKDVLLPAAAAATTFVTALLAAQQISKATSAVQILGTVVAGLGPAVTGAVAAIGGIPVLIGAAILAVIAALVVAYLKIKPFRKFVDGIARAVSDFAIKAGRQIADWGKIVGRVFLRVVDAARPVTAGIAGIATGIASAVAGIPALVTRSLKGIGALFTKYIIDPLRPFGRFIQTEIAPAIAAAQQFFSAFFNKLVEGARVVQTILTPVMKAQEAVIRVLAGVVKDNLVAAWNVLVPIMTTAANVIKTIIVTLARVVIPILVTAFNGIKLSVQISWNAVVAIIRTALGIIKGIFQIFTGLLTGDWSKLWQGVQTIVKAPLTATYDFVKRTLDALTTFVSGLVRRVGDIFRAIWNGVKAITSDVLGGVVRTVRALLDGMVSTIGSLPRRLAGIGYGMFDFIKQAFRGAINFVIRAWNGLEFRVPSIDIGPVQFGGYTIGVPDIPEIRDRGGSTFPGKSYLIGPVLEAFSPGRGHVMPQDQLLKALTGAGGGSDGGVTFAAGAVQVDARGIQEPETVGDYAARIVGWRVSQQTRR